MSQDVPSPDQGGKSPSPLAGEGRGGGRFAALIILSGAVAGLALWALTTFISRSHLSGLPGDGALVVPFGLGPAIVAGGWAMVILRMRGHPRWFQLGIGSGLIGVALVAASLLSLIVLSPAARDAGSTASLLFGFLLYGWLLGSPITAALIPAPDPERAGPPFWSIAAILLIPVTLIGGCEAGAAVMPT
jgi:hypothetical protein